MSVRLPYPQKSVQNQNLFALPRPREASTVAPRLSSSSLPWTGGGATAGGGENRADEPQQQQGGGGGGGWTTVDINSSPQSSFIPIHSELGNGGGDHGISQVSTSTPVDLRLAHTYLPAFSCLVRATVLIVVLSRQWGIESVPLQIVLALVLYIERVVRNENIFDSNAVLCSILGAHVINLFRASPEQHHLVLSTVGASSGVGMDMSSDGTRSGVGVDMSSDSTVPLSPIHPNLVGQICHATYWLISLCLILGVDLVAVLAGYLCSGTPVHRSARAPFHVNLAGFPTVIVHALFLGCIIQTPLNHTALSPMQTIMRSYTFVVLCLTWTYVKGIPEMCVLLASTARSPVVLGVACNKGNRKRSVVNTIVQSFIPCQLRFTVVLFSDLLYFYLTATTMSAAVLYLVYKLGRVGKDATAVVTHPEYRHSFQPVQEAKGCGSVETHDGETPIPPLFVSHNTSDQGGDLGSGMLIRSSRLQHAAIRQPHTPPAKNGLSSSMDHGAPHHALAYDNGPSAMRPFAESTRLGPGETGPVSEIRPGPAETGPLSEIRWGAAETGSLSEIRWGPAETGLLSETRPGSGAAGSHTENRPGFGAGELLSEITPGSDIEDEAAMSEYGNDRLSEGKNVGGSVAQPILDDVAMFQLAMQQRKQHAM